MNKKILIIDNYDSFTFNIVHLVRSIFNCQVIVERNDAVTKESLETSTHLIFSPGPGIPSEAGMMPVVLKTYSERKNILGICLGHQALAETFGAKLHRLQKVYHGVKSKIFINDSLSIFEGLNTAIEVGRYHSWVVDKRTLPSDLKTIAEDQDGTIMAIAHKKLPIFGVQFHPESILTPQGDIIIRNFLNLKERSL